MTPTTEPVPDAVPTPTTEPQPVGCCQTVEPDPDIDGTTTTTTTTIGPAGVELPVTGVDPVTGVALFLAVLLTTIGGGCLLGARVSRGGRK